MTTIVQNVKYMQSIYRKYQLFAIGCALFTLIAVCLAAYSGIRLNKLREAQAKVLEKETLSNSQINADVQKELKETKLYLKSSQQQLSEEKEKVERLRQMLNGLERQLSAAQGKSAIKTDESLSAPKQEGTSVTGTSKTRRRALTPIKPTPSPTDTTDEVRPSEEDSTKPTTAIPTPEESPSPSTPSPGTTNRESD